jgi:hypothetical protein
VAGYLVDDIRLLETVTMQKIWAGDPARHHPPRATIASPGTPFRLWQHAITAMVKDVA